MSSENDADEPERPTGPEQADQREVRRLLADASGPLTVPDEVSRRLDDTLAGLVSERRAERLAAAPGDDAAAPGGDGAAVPHAPGSPEAGAAGLAEDGSGAEVVALSTRRRRWPRALLAAASVTVAGYAASVGLDLGGGTSEFSGAGDDGARSPAAESSTGSGQRLAPAPEFAAAQPGGPVSARLGWGALAVRAAYADLGSDTLAEDVAPLGEAILRERSTPPPRGDLQERRVEADARAGIQERPRCDRPAAVDDQTASDEATAWLLVRFDGARATLVLDPVGEEEYRATVYSCAGADRLASATVPYR